MHGTVGQQRSADAFHVARCTETASCALWIVLCAGVTCTDRERAGVSGGRAGKTRSELSPSFQRVLPHHLAALPPGALRRLHDEMTAEQRMRLIAGMKRYAYRKRHEGAPRPHTRLRRSAAVVQTLCVR